MNRYSAIVFISLLAAAALQPAPVRAFPTKPLRIIVPFPPGGGTDIVTRMVAQRLTDSLGQPVITDNRPGAGGIIGTVIAAKAPADGHTLLMAVSAHAINPSLHRDAGYDPVRDFSAVTLALGFPYVLVVPPSLAATNVRELIALARAQPGTISFASSGTGGGNHMAGEMFKGMAKVDIVHVPYKGGAAAMNEVMGGHVSMIFGTVLETLPQARAGRLRALAVSSAKRAAVAPELPTVAEAALPGYEATGWYSFVVPAGTPRPVVARLNREITRILSLPEVKERLVALGGEPWPTSPEQAQEFIAVERARWAKVIKEAGLKPD